MTTKIFNLTSTFKSDVSDDGQIKIRGMASTADFDRAGDSISAEAWSKGGLDNFSNNPIILFNHDYNRPIGRATKVTSVDGGLHLEARISNAAKDVAELVKDGVLGAFSVGFRVKDADYVKETDGLMIKDAELFEVSVVSVPCNQAATFSLAKSFDSTEEYEEFKKTFTSVDLAGQSLAKDENLSVASDTPDGAVIAHKEIKMDEQSNVDLEAFAKKVAEETAAKIAMKQAEQKAAEEKAAEVEAQKVADEAAQKAQQEQEVQNAISVGVQSGAERLVEDVRKEMEAEKANMQEVVSKYESELKEKAAEIEAMRNSKRDFSSRKGSLKDHSKELLQAHILGKITRKGYDTDFARDVFEKAEVTYDATSSAGIDVMVSSAFEEEVRQAQKVAPIFRELQVASGATVLPIAPDTEAANFSSAGAETAANNLEEAGASDNNYNVNRVVLQAHRLISSTFITNDTDEQVVVALLPIIQSALARAHAVAIDSAILVGASAGSISTGLVGANGTDNTSGFATASATTALDASGTDEVTPANLLGLRKEMGKYGMDPSRVAYIVPNDVYYELIDASGFTDVQEVGSDIATKLVGVVGSVFGSPVIATDRLANNLGAAGAATTTAALAVNVDNYVIPRLRGVSIETDYIVKEQRSVIVASQSLGFNELVANSGSNVPSVRWPFA